MKKIFLFLFVLSISMSSYSKAKSEIHSLEESKAKIDISHISETRILYKDAENDTIIRLVSEYLGQSTDVSPQINLYLTYYHGSEMNNTKTAFLLGSFVVVKKVKKLSETQFEISYLNIEMKVEKMIIDFSKVLKDDKNLKLEEFQDLYFKSKLSVE